VSNSAIPKTHRFSRTWALPTCAQLAAIMPHKPKGNMSKLPKKLTIDKIMQAVEDDNNTGFCIACGAKSYCCEPDARGYRCESCGASKVYGAAELMIMFAF
jgi:hypothetical protein